jgi:tryptophan-rich sensory protein
MNRLEPFLRLEPILVALSILAIIAIFAAEILRNHSHLLDKLPRPMLHAFRITLGFVFLILAVIGGLLPILQGWIFFLLALLMFFPQSRIAVGVLDKAEHKVPRVVKFLRRHGIGTHRGAGQKTWEDHS